jgi:hypothetical protein
VTKRNQRKALARWETETRVWATDTGRALVLAVCGGDPVPVTPYHVGVVLDRSEQAWVECPVRFLQETPPSPAITDMACWPPVRPWLVTSQRVVGRLGNDRLYGYRWEYVAGCRVDVTPGREVVSLDLRNGVPLTWTGPGVGPMGVAAVYHLHGSQALLDHPGLTPLRVAPPDMSLRPLAELTTGANDFPLSI